MANEIKELHIVCVVVEINTKWIEHTFLHVDTNTKGTCTSPSTCAHVQEAHDLNKQYFLKKT